jgi:hypothetical protein
MGDQHGGGAVSPGAAMVARALAKTMNRNINLVILICCCINHICIAESRAVLR